MVIYNLNVICLLYEGMLDIQNEVGVCIVEIIKKP